MGTKTYYKLVRDNVPEIISKAGRKPYVRTLDENTYYLELRKKLQEEVDEFFSSNDDSELADILEVLEAIAVAKGADIEVIRKIQEEKAATHGKFVRKILLEKVEEAGDD